LFGSGIFIIAAVLITIGVGWYLNQYRPLHQTVIRQEATELGITVSRDEVDKELKSLDPPLSKDYRDFVRASMLIDKLQAEYFDERVPVNAEQRHIMAMLLESENQVAEVKTRIEEGEDFAELAGELRG